MKRFHVHLGVNDLEQSIRFYSGLFGAPPTVRKDDYAKWMIEDPRVNFAISARGGGVGVNHLGLQADSAAELGDIREQFGAADQGSLVDEPGTSCCYARSDKHWVTDPQGIAWEGYHTLGEVRLFNGDPASAETPQTSCCVSPQDAASASCGPAANAQSDSGTASRCCG